MPVLPVAVVTAAKKVFVVSTVNNSTVPGKSGNAPVVLAVAVEAVADANTTKTVFGPSLAKRSSVPDPTGNGAVDDVPVTDNVAVLPLVNSGIPGIRPSQISSLVDAPTSHSMRPGFQVQR